jgi:hypothetical protein
MCIKINKIGKQEVGIWWVQKRFPRYGIPIWSLWPNIRFLPSIVAEKNEHICSMCIKINKGVKPPHFPLKGKESEFKQNKQSRSHHQWHQSRTPWLNPGLPNIVNLANAYIKLVSGPCFVLIVIPPLPEGGGGILFYLCPSVQDIFHSHISQ